MKPELTISRGWLTRSSIWLAAMIWVARAAAATITWNNPAGGEWDTAANWSPALVPGTGDTAVFEGTASYAVVVAGNRPVGTLAVENPNAVLRLVGRQGTGNALLTVANGFENLGGIELTSEFSSYSATLNVTAGALTNAAGGVIRVLEGTAGSRTLGLELDNRGAVEIERSVSLTKAGAQHRNSGTIHLAESTSLTVGGGGAIEVTHAGGAWTGTGALNLPAGRPFILESDFELETVVVDWQSVTIEGPGTFRVPSDRTLTCQSTTINAPLSLVGNMEIWGNTSLNSPFAIPAGSTVRMLGRQGGGNSILTVANGFENLGGIELTSEFSSYSATLNVTAGALTNAAGGVIRVLEGAAGSRTLGLELDNRGTLWSERDVTLNRTAAQHRNSGLLEVRAGEFTLQLSGGTPAFTNAGELRVLAEGTFRRNGGALINTAEGLVSGTGTVEPGSGTFTNEGTVAPGLSTGTLSVAGNYPQGEDATLDVEIGGFTAGTEHDVLAVSGAATLDGTLLAGLTDGFSPTQGDSFVIVTYGSRTGEFGTVESAEPDRIAWRVDYAANGALLIVANTAPTLTPIADQTVQEGASLTINIVAGDQDLPAQVMTYALETGPAGMTVNPGTGQIAWTPAEDQGPGNFAVTVRVTDDGSPALSHTTNCTVTVDEVNVVPVLVLPGAQVVNELTELVFAVNATDADLPVNALTFEMTSGPTGAAFDAATGEFRWTPTEAQGPGVYAAAFRVTDSNPDAVNAQAMSATGEVSITVNEVNQPPVLAPVPGATIHAGDSFRTALMATDPDLPVNRLTYALVSGPAGASVDPDNGDVAWSAPLAAAETVVDLTAQVTDDGVPAWSAERSFQVTVVGPVEFLTVAQVGDQLRVSWRTIPGRTYQLLSSDSIPAESWVQAGPEITAIEASTEQSVTTATESGVVYLRVRLLEP